MSRTALIQDTTIVNIRFSSNKATSVFLLKRKFQLNKIVTKADGSPDYLAINIYYDTLRSWYTPNKLKTSDGKILEVAKLKTKGLYLNYEKLAKTHGCSKETIRKKLVKLEKLGLIQRSYQHKETVTNKSYNQLIIYVWKQTAHFYNQYGIEQSDVPELKPQTNYEYITEKYNIDYYSKIEQINDIESKGGIHKLEDTKKLIESFNKLKDRSRANFVKNSFDSFSDQKESTLESENKPSENRQDETKNNKVKNTENQKEESKALSVSRKTDTNYNNCELSTNKNTNGFLSSGKYLNEMLEYITDEVCNSLRTNSGRNFTDRAIKEIAKAVSRSKKGAKAFFYHINGFIVYLSKILTFEKRDPIKISSENYYIAANQTDEEKEINHYHLRDGSLELRQEVAH